MPFITPSRSWFLPIRRVGVVLRADVERDGVSRPTFTVEITEARPDGDVVARVSKVLSIRKKPR
jgi:hypothetical protein